MSDLVERLRGAASGLDYIAMLIENGSIDQGSERQSSAVAQAAENVREAAARITALETALAEAEGQVETARNAALEEAAKVAGELEVSGKTTTMEWANCMAHARDIAQAIRNMKDMT